MEINNQFVSCSFDYKSSNGRFDFNESVNNVDVITNYCYKNKERVYYSDDIYEAEIIPQCSLMDWLYCEKDTIENLEAKTILREILDKRCTQKGNSGMPINICLYDINNDNIEFVNDINDWFNIRRYYLSKSPSKEAFLDDIHISFPDILFSNEIKTGLNTLDFNYWINNIIEHLSILNDSGLKLYDDYGELEAIKIISSILPNESRCSGQNRKNRNKLVFSFEVEIKSGNKIEVKTFNIACLPHTKIERADSDARIYFKFQDNQIYGGKKLLVGWIGVHRD